MKFFLPIIETERLFFETDNKKEKKMSEASKIIETKYRIIELLTMVEDIEIIKKIQQILINTLDSETKND